MNQETIGLIVGLIGLIAIILGIIVLFYVYIYLWKFEKEHNIDTKGRGLYWERIICCALLGRMAMRGPGKPLPKDFICDYYGIQYQKVPYEHIRPFKVSYWITFIGLFLGIVAFLTGKIFLD